MQARAGATHGARVGLTSWEKVVARAHYERAESGMKLPTRWRRNAHPSTRLPAHWAPQAAATWPPNSRPRTGRSTRRASW